MESVAPNVPTTRWSLILTQRNSGPEASVRANLGQLCQIYWRPIFAFICRRGYPAPEAQDLTQDFFVMVLEHKLFAVADPERGRFRSFLLKSLQNFLLDVEKSRRTHKRGGKYSFVSWEQWMGEAPSQLLISGRALESCSAETLFDLRWAATVAEQALVRLRYECESRGQRRLFENLRDYLTAERTDVSYGALARSLGVRAAVVKRLMHEFRMRYRRLLREAVAATVQNDADVDQEIRYLCTVMAKFSA